MYIMKELMIFNNEEFGNVRMVEIDGKPYAVGTDVAEMLEYERPSKAVSDHCKSVLKWDGLKVGGYPIKLIPQDDIIRLIQKSRTKPIEYKNMIKEWLVTLGVIYDKFVVETREEINFIDALEKSLKPLNISGIKQYRVLNYRIDFYIPSLNIAIEYDENAHKSYTYVQQEGRQKDIEQELGCKFVRVSDKNSDEYNIGYVIKTIYEMDSNKCNNCGCPMTLHNNRYTCGNCGSSKKYNPTAMFL